MLKTRNESQTEYFREHDGLMEELESLNAQFKEYKEEFFAFIEQAM